MAGRQCPFSGFFQAPLRLQSYRVNRDGGRRDAPRPHTPGLTRTQVESSINKLKEPCGRCTP